MKRKKKFSKGTGHSFSFVLLIIFAFLLVLGKIIEVDDEGYYELAQYATNALVMAIGVEIGIAVTTNEEA